MATPDVDTLGPAEMAAWLRETAANTRRHRETPYLTDKEMNLAPHVAFRLEQAAELIERLHGALRAIQTMPDEGNEWEAVDLYEKARDIAARAFTDTRSATTTGESNG